MRATVYLVQNKRGEKGMSKEKVTVQSEGIRDARQLGYGRMLVVGFQHLFAMFGATVLVPLITGLDISTT